ncbi:hypothetical protein PG997_003245 [Apiospora hydei]|uniref:Cytochrome P450 monooxygenase n=1 Tax=Apiospora hydei TaxID=1337664 RepID=A0ABR1WYP9_9PEZI
MSTPFLLLPVPGLALILISIALAYLVTSSVYAITLHPLASVPGPKLCAISRLPYWLAYFRGVDVYWLNRLHQRYGPVVRFGPTDLSYTAAEAWQDIHGFAKGQPENPKAPEFSVQPVNGVPSMLTATFEDHARVRKAFSPAFSERALRAQEPLFENSKLGSPKRQGQANTCCEIIDLLAQKIGELGKDQQPLELTRLLNFTTFDIMAELCFGSPLGLLEKNEFSPWVASVFQGVKMLPIVSMICYYPLLNALFTHFEPKSVTEQRVTHCKHSADRVDQRLREGSNQPDVWTLVSEDTEKSDTKLSLKEMHSNAELFMLAGSETTGTILKSMLISHKATLLSGVMYLLLKDAAAMLRLSQELPDRRGNHVFRPFYLALPQCLSEGSATSIPTSADRLPRVVPEGGKSILGRWVPPETRVAVHHYSTYHSEANFKDAASFVPERWLGDPRYANDNQASHAPFGWGHRNCLGQNMAMHEMRLILARLIFAYDWQLCEESRGWLEQKAYALWQKERLCVTVTPK